MGLNAKITDQPIRNFRNDGPATLPPYPNLPLFILGSSTTTVITALGLSAGKILKKMQHGDYSNIFRL